MEDSKVTRATAIQDSIRQVLRNDWNPIGFDEQLPQDEYDSYIAPLYRVLTGHRSEQELIDLFFYIEREHIGLCCYSPEQLRPVAIKLLNLDVSL